MKHPIIKRIGAVILLCAFLYGYYQLNISYINAKNAESLARLSSGRLDSIMEAVSSIEADQDQAIGAIMDRMLVSAELKADMLRQSEACGSLANQENGMVVRVNNGRVTYPAGSTIRFGGCDDLFTANPKAGLYLVRRLGEEDTTPAVLCACPVEGDQYYVTWTDESETVGLFSVGTDELFNQVSAVEIAHRGFFLKVTELDGNLLFSYRSNRFEDYETPEAMGITREVLAAKPETLVIDGISYHCDFRTTGDEGDTCIFLTLLPGSSTDPSSQAAIITALAGIILAAIAAWHLATQRFVVDKILTRPMQTRYKPSSMRWMTLVLGGVAIAGIFATGCVVHLISDFFGRSVDAGVSLAILGTRLEQNASLEASFVRENREWQLECARDLAEGIGMDPGLAAREPLARFNDTIGARYIMLFDGDGNECACSTRYTGFALGEAEGDSTTDFRRLLLGVPELVHEPAVDERTGLNTRMVGVGCPMPDGRYGALILAFEPDVVDASTDSNELLHSQTAPGWTALAFDAEDRTVRFASDPLYVGMSADIFGLNDGNFGNRYIDSFVLMGRRCYGFSMQRDGLVYYFVNRTNGLTRSTAAYGLLAAVGFAAIYLVMAIYLMLGYTNKWYEYYSVIGAEFDSRASETVMPDGKIKRSIDPSRRWAFNFADWRNMLPEQVGKSVFGLGVGVCMIWLIIDVVVKRYATNDIVGFIVRGEWNRGFNLFSIVAILMLGLGISLALILIKLALKLTSMALDTKGETICRLAFNLLEYVGVILLLFYGFEFLGIDVRALLAPLALVSLAISLGSRQLVEDILAGITIVFEGEYQVGDVIDVGGYRGKVVEVGVRTTKLLGKGDNIKILSNRDVRNVLNMSRLNSWIDMEFTVSNSVPIQKIEEVMERELPEIGRSVPDIISGPIYKGIVSLNGSRVTIAVTCECNEEVSYRVQRELYAKFHEMFERESLPLA